MVERDINYKLISEIEKYPLLYNFNLPEYTNKVLVDKAWNEIAKKINITVADCKEKWRNIRSSFIRSKKAPPSGSKPKKPYYLGEYLGFVKPYVKAMQNATDQGNANSHKLQQVSLKIHHQSQLKDKSGEASDQSDNDMDNSSNSFIKPFRMSQLTVSTRKRPIPEVDKSQMEYLKKKKENQMETPCTQTTNPMQYFFLSLLSEFDTMPESQIRQFKIRVLQLIEEIKANTSPLPSRIAESSGSSHMAYQPSVSKSTPERNVEYSMNYSPLHTVNSPGPNLGPTSSSSSVTLYYDNVDVTHIKEEDTHEEENSDNDN